MSKLDAITERGLQNALVSWFVMADAESDNPDHEMIDALCREIDYETDDCPDDDFDPPLIDAMAFDDAGVLTRNAGLVVKIGDREFQVSIVRSR